VRAGPRGIASQFTCALAAAGEATSKTATRLALRITVTMLDCTVTKILVIQYGGGAREFHHCGFN